MSNERLVPQQLPTWGALNRLDTLRKLVVELYEYHGHRPLGLRWGLYIGDRLYPDARRIYFQQFGALLLKPTQDHLLGTLHGLPAPPGQCSRIYEALKAYLVTTTENQQTSDKSTREFLPPALLNAWAGERDIDTARTDLARSQFDFYSSQLSGENPIPYDYDSSAVTLAREFLSKSCSGQGVYQLMLADASKANPKVRFRDPQNAVVDPTEVDGAFTKSGWAFMRNDAFKHPERYVGGESWVLGTASAQSVDTTKLAESFQSKYQQDYIDHWRAFLKSGRVLPYNGLADASQKLAKLSGNQSPLLALFCVAAQNTNPDPDIAKAFQPVQKVVDASSCQDRPVGPATNNYVNNLGAIQMCLVQAGNASADQKDAAKAGCVNTAGPAEQEARNIGRTFNVDRDGHVDETVLSLLLAPITGVIGELHPAPPSGAPLCEKMRPLMAKFPFNPQATAEASLDELKAIFDPVSGSLTQLNNAVTKSGQPVGPVSRSFLERAMSFQHALYMGGPGQPQFKYKLTPHGTETITSVELSLNGQSLTYSGGNARPTDFSWPGTTQSARLTAKSPIGAPFDLDYDALWGVFHLFYEHANWLPGGPPYNIEVVLSSQGVIDPVSRKPYTVRFDLDTGDAPPIFDKNYLAGLQHCPSNLAK